MTLTEYTKQMDELVNELEALEGEEFEQKISDISEFQYEYMGSVLEKYKANVDCKEKEHVYDMLEFIVNHGTNGSVCINVEDEGMANRVADLLCEELGEYTLEAPEIFEYDGKWNVDAIFGGYFVPEWDGFTEERW